MNTANETVVETAATKHGGELRLIRSDFDVRFKTWVGPGLNDFGPWQVERQSAWQIEHSYTADGEVRTHRGMGMGEAEARQRFARHAAR